MGIGKRVIHTKYVFPIFYSFAAERVRKKLRFSLEMLVNFIIFALPKRLVNQLFYDCKTLKY